MIHKQNKYIKLFNDLGAIDLEHSINLDDVGISKRYVFNRMIYRGIFIECEHKRFYIDNQAVARFKENTRKKALILSILILVFFAIYYFAVSR